jgi:hypothetical protein
MVGVAGLEPATSCSRSMRASHLRYTPMGSAKRRAEAVVVYEKQGGLFMGQKSLRAHASRIVRVLSEAARHTHPLSHFIVTTPRAQQYKNKNPLNGQGHENCFF